MTRGANFIRLKTGRHVGRNCPGASHQPQMLTLAWSCQALKVLASEPNIRMLVAPLKRSAQCRRVARCSVQQLSAARRRILLKQASALMMPRHHSNAALTQPAITQKYTLELSCSANEIPCKVYGDNSSETRALDQLGHCRRLAQKLVKWICIKRTSVNLSPVSCMLNELALPT